LNYFQKIPGLGVDLYPIADIVKVMNATQPLTGDTKMATTATEWTVIVDHAAFRTYKSKAAAIREAHTWEHSRGNRVWVVDNVSGTGPLWVGKN